MPQKTNKFERFWQELKRRRVFGVVTTYAATAYIIIEVTNNIVSPLHLPVWVPTVVIFVLIAGLPATIVLSWIFDFTSQGLKKTESLEELGSKKIQARPSTQKLRASYVLNAILLIIVAVLAYPRIFKRDTIDRLRSSGERLSVTVMPFRNMTSDTTWNVWHDGIQEILTSSLSASDELSVRQSESVRSLLQGKGLTDEALLTPSMASNLSQRLGTNVFVYGNIIKSGESIRINAQLIDSRSKEVLQSFNIDGTPKNIIPLIDSISVLVRNYLIIFILKKKENPDFSREPAGTNSPEAYRYNMYALDAIRKENWSAAEEFCKKAIALDSDFMVPYLNIVGSYLNQFLGDSATKWVIKAYKKRDKATRMIRLCIEEDYAGFFLSPEEDIKCYKEIFAVDDQQPISHYSLGISYRSWGQSDNALAEFEKALEIYHKWRIKPLLWDFYEMPAEGYIMNGQYNKAKKTLRMAEKDFPDCWEFPFYWALMATKQGDTVRADRYLAKYKSGYRKHGGSEESISFWLAQFYGIAGNSVKEEEYLRKTLILNPDNSEAMKQLADLLIHTGFNINEGVELAEKLLKSSPDNQDYLSTKAWGFYKQGKYQEAFNIFKRLDSIKPVHTQGWRSQFEAVKDAVARIK